MFLDKCLYKLQMLEYDRRDFSEGINVKKKSASKECNTCHYWYFLDKGLKFQLCVCHECHDLTQKAMNLDDIAIVFAKGNSYRFYFC